METERSEKLLERRDLLVRVAKMYYIEQMTQQEIADKVFLSRSNISRILKCCVDQQIVEFYINETSSLGFSLIERLRAAYGLKDAIVIPAQPNNEEAKKKLGAALFSYFRKSYLKSGMSLGVAWGTTLYHVASAFKPMPDYAVDVVQLVGGIGAKSVDTDGVEITKRIVQNFNGNAYVPHAPYIVRDEKLKKLLLKEPDIAAHFKRAGEVDLALVGIGSSTKVMSSSARAGYVSAEEVALQMSEGAVCDICGMQFNTEGKHCALQFEKKLISISYKALAKIPVVIGAAVGIEKTDAIHAALKSGLIDIVATDEPAALSLLEKQTAKI